MIYFFPKRILPFIKNILKDIKLKSRKTTVKKKESTTWYMDSPNRPALLVLTTHQQTLNGLYNMSPSLIKSLQICYDCVTCKLASANQCITPRLRNVKEKKNLYLTLHRSLSQVLEWILTKLSSSAQRFKKKKRNTNIF